MSTPRHATSSAAKAVLVLLLMIPARLGAQPNATLLGRVLDASGAVLPGATVGVRDRSTGFERSVPSDQEGRYHVAAIPAGSYDVTAAATGFKSAVIEALTFDVGRTLVRDFQLEVGDRREVVIVTTEAPLIDRATAAVGHVVTPQTVREIPLNGRYFADLGLLVPGSVAPSQAGWSSTPIRGQGSLSFNTSGNREEAVGFLVNGVSISNLTFGSLAFQPPVASVREFKVDNSTFGAEYGHVSGAIVNIVTRSGTDVLRGEVFGFVRNDAFDARNFFEFTSADPHPFERYQFGGLLGGPVIRRNVHFFTTFEGFRQRQGLDMNSLVLSDEQRAAATDPVIGRLIELIPRANFFDVAGTPRFVGAAAAVADTNRFTADLQQTLGRNDRIHLFYGRQSTQAREPSSVGNSIPGFGTVRHVLATVLTIGETRILGSTLLNEARFGRSTLAGDIQTAAQLNPADLGLRSGITRPIGLPQVIVAGDLNFGGPAAFPQGRNDTSYVVNNTLSHVRGRHSVRLGGEYRHFINENFAEGTGAFSFPTVDAFLAGAANGFSITLGERRNVIDQRAVGLFVQDSVTIGSPLTLDLGLRYEWHVTPTERNDELVVFDADDVSLKRVGVDVDEIYEQNDVNLEPRLGIAWSPDPGGRTVVRAAYAWAVDQPGTAVVKDTASNPPFATPLAASGSISPDSALDVVRPVGLAPITVDPTFRNASLHSWNINVQRQLAVDLAAMAGYFGASGRNLTIARNINQPVDGVRPFTALSSSSPIRPNEPLGNITQVESTGFSNYHGLWLSLTKRLSRGLQFDASYAWSKSMDTNSLGSRGFAIQNSYDIPGQYGPSDFDVRHRFVFSGTYELPFDAHPLIRGWQVAAIVQSQSGNPVNIVTSNSSLNGLPNTVRPELIGPVRIIGSVDRWFDPSVFVAVDRFGSLGRNAVIGPGFHNTDLSVIKNVRVRARGQLQFRVDVFNLFNHPNLGPPGNIVGSPTFGRITRTRLPTGEAGSSRQIQFGLRVSL